MITEECPDAIFLMCFQIVVGTIIDGYFSGEYEVIIVHESTSKLLLSGIVIAKLTRARKRTKTLIFSRYALVSEIDGKLCLLFRVGDLQLKNLNGASVSLLLINDKETKEGVLLRNYLTDLDITGDSIGPDLFFIWPFVIYHPIDEDSPFYGTQPSDLLQGDFELVLSLEGSHPTTGQDTKAMTSYLPHEILWGYRFEEVVAYDKEREGYMVDFSKFNATIAVETPLCSAKDLEEHYRSEKKGGTQFQI